MTDHIPKTVDDIYRDYQNRRKGLLKALSEGMAARAQGRNTTRGGKGGGGRTGAGRGPGARGMKGSRLGHVGGAPCSSAGILLRLQSASVPFVPALICAWLSWL